jgi:hypothetical protein
MLLKLLPSGHHLDLPHVSAATDVRGPSIKFLRGL